MTDLDAGSTSERTGRSVVVGSDPEGCDRAGPSYPAAFVAFLVFGAGSRVLDVGRGTGKAGRLFADRGEEWDPAGRRFDLVVGGRARHWFDPRIGPTKVAGFLVECRATTLILATTVPHGS